MYPFVSRYFKKDLIEHGAVRWTVASLPAPIPYLYLDYVQAIGTLLLTTQRADRNRLIFTGVLNQAIALSRSSRWVEEELKFEGMIDGVDRGHFLRLNLEQNGATLTMKRSIPTMNDCTVTITRSKATPQRRSPGQHYRSWLT